MTAESGTERVVVTGPHWRAPDQRWARASESEPAGTVQAPASRAAVRFGPGPAITGLRSPLVFVVATSETQADSPDRTSRRSHCRGRAQTLLAALGLVAKLVLPRAPTEMREPAFERRRCGHQGDLGTEKGPDRATDPRC